MPTRRRLITTALVVLTISGSRAQLANQSQAATHSLTIRAKQSQYRAGSQVSIEVITKNVSDHEIEAIETDRTPSATELQIDVRDATGKPATETALNKAIRGGEALRVVSSLGGLGEHSMLQPGKSRTDEIRIDQMFDLSHPGKYTVQVQRRDDKTGAVVRSNSVAIAVAE